MPTGPGRDPVKAMSRVLRLMAILDEAGNSGVSRNGLIDVGEYGESDPATQLGKDLKHLRDLGLQVDNIAGQGEPAHYCLVTGDNRLRLKLSPPQLAALQRAVMLADRADLAKSLGVRQKSLPPTIDSPVLPKQEQNDLSKSLQGIQSRSRVDFVYKGTPRAVHPGAVRYQNYGWYLSGVEEGDDKLKHFAVGRMSETSLDKPGTARAVPEVGRIPLHPLLWEVDPPTTVTLRTPSEYVADVERWLREPETRQQGGDDVDMTYTVTNRQAFRARIYVLGPRVRLVGPEEFRDEMLAELRDLVGE